jgi:hypothetical protein
VRAALRFALQQAMWRSTRRRTSAYRPGSSPGSVLDASEIAALAAR